MLKRHLFVILLIYISLIPTQTTTIINNPNKQRINIQHNYTIPIPNYLNQTKNLTPSPEETIIINNVTVIENETLILNNSILIEKNGTLIIRRSNITTPNNPNLDIIVRGELIIENSTLYGPNLTIDFYREPLSEEKYRANITISYSRIEIHSLFFYDIKSMDELRILILHSKIDVISFNLVTIKTQIIDSEIRIEEGAKIFLIAKPSLL